MANIAHGHRDERGKWHADNPEEYPSMDVHGQLPWSVLDQSSAHWRERVKWWRDQGVDDIEPRLHSPAMISTGRHGKTSAGVSRFDPFLAELLIEWFTAPGWWVYDPCAGGPVRGIVTGHLSRQYVGVDLSPMQIDANRKCATRWELPATPAWLHGDGTKPHYAHTGYDFVMTCPPYHNRERYSDDHRDLSAMSWDDFVHAHAQLVNNAASALKLDRFMAWVISDVRDSKGHMRGLPAIAEQQIRDAGLHITNQLVLVEPGGLRVKTMRRPWEACRTTTRRHQVVIIAVKGDRRRATKAVRDAA